MSWHGFARNSLSSMASTTTNGRHGDEDSAVAPHADVWGEHNPQQQNANDRNSAPGGATAHAHAHATRAAHAHREPARSRSRQHQGIPRAAVAIAIPDPGAAIRARSANNWADAAGSADWANRTRSAQQQSAQRLPPQFQAERPAREGAQQQGEIHAETLLVFSRAPIVAPVPRRMPVGLPANPTSSGSPPSPSPRHEDEGDRIARDRQRIDMESRRFREKKNRRGLDHLSVVTQEARVPERSRQARAYRRTSSHELTPGPRTSRHRRLHRRAILEAHAVAYRRESQHQHQEAGHLEAQEPEAEHAHAHAPPVLLYHGLPPQVAIPDPRAPEQAHAAAAYAYPRAPAPEHELTPGQRSLRLDSLQFEIALQSLDMQAWTCQFNCAAGLRRMREQ